MARMSVDLLVIRVAPCTICRIHPEIMADTAVQNSFGDLHKERIYRALESAINSEAPGLGFALTGIVDWGWIGENFCLFFNPGSLFGFWSRPDQMLARYLRAFGSKHGIQIELRELDVKRTGRYSPYRQKL